MDQREELVLFNNIMCEARVTYMPLEIIFEIRYILCDAFWYLLRLILGIHLIAKKEFFFKYIRIYNIIITIGMGLINCQR